MRKTITIKRKVNKTNLPQEVYDSSTQSIGATFNAAGKVNTGLTHQEIEELMPSVLSISKTDIAFRREVENFFLELEVKVPAAGVDLNIATDKEGNPVEPLDYIKYKFACSHPYVVENLNNPEEKAKKRKYRYFVEDQSREKAIKVAAKNARKEAIKTYAQLTGSIKKMEQVLRVIGDFRPTMDKDDMELALEKAATNDPSGFLEVAKSKTLETTAFIRECLTQGVLTKVGNSILNGEEVLGGSEKEAVLFLDNKANSETVVTLKARLAQFQKASQ